jgi:hypothetical protein
MVLTDILKDGHKASFGLLEFVPLVLAWGFIVEIYIIYMLAFR